MMYELTYESVAKKGLTNADLEDILDTSRTHNAKNGITGCLIYYNNRFIQILEGSQQAVQETYARIKVDKRHKKVWLIAENSTDKRTFPEWGMACFSVDKKGIGDSELERFRNNLQLLADFSRPASVTTILFWKKIKMLVADPPGQDV